MLFRTVANPRRLVLLLLVLLTTACGGVINPPVPPTRPAPPPPRPTSTPVPTPTPEPERWVKNHRITPMWSAPQGASGAVTFGNTSSTFCSFRVVEEADNARILVYNPHTDGTFWIDVEAVGPVENAPRRAGVKPAGVNCTEAIYDISVVLPAGPTGTPTTPAELTRTPQTDLTRTSTPVPTADLTRTATPTTTVESTRTTTPTVRSAGTVPPTATATPTPTRSP
jgi:hypothetical protein